MASVFKTKSSDRYTILYYDENGTRRKKTGYTDKRESQRLAVKLEDQARRIRDGLDDPKDKAYRDHEAKALADHVDDYERYLLAKGNCQTHADQTARQSRAILALAKARRISELSLSKITESIDLLRKDGRGTETVNHYIRAVKGFSRWLWRDGRARDHHLAHLATSSSEGDRKHMRRALTEDEAGRLVQAAEAGPAAGNLPASDRAMLYAVALSTGFRADELRSLTPERFDLAGDRPTATVPAAYTKNGKLACQPLPQWLVDRLRPWLSLKAPGRPVFEGMTKRTSEMLQGDLERAGIPYETDSGAVDFHALRGTYISHLVSSGASVKTCQTLARHSTPSLTIGLYAKASLHDIGGAVDALPDLTPKQPVESEALAATGTYGATGTATSVQLVDTDDSTQTQCLKLLSSSVRLNSSHDSNSPEPPAGERSTCAVFSPALPASWGFDG